MILKINQSHSEKDLDFLKKIIIFENKNYENFDMYTSLEDLTTKISIINNFVHNVLFLTLLPNDIIINEKINSLNGLKSFKIDISFKIHLTSEIEKIVKKFQNKEVFVIIEKTNAGELYGSSKEPLVINFDKSNSQKTTDFRGLICKINGIITEEPRFMKNKNYTILNRSLGQKLSMKI